MTMHELFRQRPDRSRLDLEDERQLIAQAQAGVHYSAAAQWDLLRQYRGALQAASYKVRTRIRGMSPEQVDELEADIALEALDAIQAYEPERHIRFGQVLVPRLNRLAANRLEALAIPSNTLARWSKILRLADGDHAKAAEIAPKHGMTSDTFRAIHHALDYSTEEWSQVPYSAERVAADTTTHDLAHAALGRLQPAEREVIELAYGFRGDPKSDGEVAEILEDSRENVKKRRVRALEKLRGAL